MNQSATTDPLNPNVTLPVDKRRDTLNQPTLMFRELDPALVVEGIRLEVGYLTEEIRSFGNMRETCPNCNDVHLQLVLRQKNVRLAHLFCVKCTRCFDACDHEGYSALSII